MFRKSTKGQRGQALIETLIAAALVLVPLFLAIPVIAKYLDIRSHVVQAARYAAWERTVWFGGDAAEPMGLGSGGPFSNKWDANEKKDGEIRAELGARILSETNANSGFTDSDKSAGGSPYGAKNFWRDRRGNVLANYGDVSGKFSGKDADGVYNAPAPGLFNELFGPIMNVAAVVSNFTVETHGEYTTKVGLSVQQVAFNPDTGLGGCKGCDTEFLASGTPQTFSETNVLVANGWSANGPGSLKDFGDHPEKITVYNQTRGLTPTSLINPPAGAFRTALDVLQTIALVFFPELSTLDLGRIEVDKVPADRLK
jgi:hypothetical protein